MCTDVPFYQIPFTPLEVPGTNSVQTCWQRIRWINGVTCQWIGREKEAGIG